MKLLLVENDLYDIQRLKESLTHQHYVVDIAKNGQEGWELIEAFRYDLLLLDAILPSLDGISLCRRLRDNGDRTPILLLSALNTIEDKVTGLDAGADDYVIKPFNLGELLARIRALLRRGNSCMPQIQKWGSLRLNFSICEASYEKTSVMLTPTECRLLELFLQGGSHILSSGIIRDNLWSYTEPPSNTSLKSYIKRLRGKLQEIGAPSDLIETVHGLGYRLNQKWHNVQMFTRKNCSNK